MGYGQVYGGQESLRVPWQRLTFVRATEKCRRAKEHIDAYYAEWDRVRATEKPRHATEHKDAYDVMREITIITIQSLKPSCHKHFEVLLLVAIFEARRAHESPSRIILHNDVGPLAVGTRWEPWKCL